MEMIERACRSLCNYNGISPDEIVGGAPAWQSYCQEVLQLIRSLREDDERQLRQAVPELTGAIATATKQWS